MAKPIFLIALYAAAVVSAAAGMNAVEQPPGVRMAARTHPKHHPVGGASAAAGSPSWHVTEFPCDSSDVMSCPSNDLCYVGCDKVGLGAIGIPSNKQADATFTRVTLKGAVVDPVNPITSITARGRGGILTTTYFTQDQALLDTECTQVFYPSSKYEWSLATGGAINDGKPRSDALASLASASAINSGLNCILYTGSKFYRSADYGKSYDEFTPPQQVIGQKDTVVAAVVSQSQSEHFIVTTNAKDSYPAASKVFYNIAGSYAEAYSADIRVASIACKPPATVSAVGGGFDNSCIAAGIRDPKLTQAVSLWRYDPSRNVVLLNNTLNGSNGYYKLKSVAYAGGDVIAILDDNRYAIFYSANGGLDFTKITVPQGYFFGGVDVTDDGCMHTVWHQGSKTNGIKARFGTYC